MTKDTGGPAFPAVIASPHDFPDGSELPLGMTLRDWFAGQALNGMLAHSTRYQPRDGRPVNWHEAISEEANQMADAMLAERNKQC